MEKILMVIPISGYDEGSPVYSVFVEREIISLEAKGMTVFKLFLERRYNLSIVLKFRSKLLNAINEYKPDIVHIQTGTAGLFLLFGKVPLPVVLTIGGSELIGYSGNLLWKLRGWIASFFTKKVCNKIDCIICVSDNLAQLLPSNLSNKITVLPRAVNTDFFKPINILEARSFLNWLPESYYVVFSDPRPQVNVKNRPLAEKVVKFVSEVLGERIKFEIITNKTSNEVVNMLNASDALLVTSFHEGSPNIVKEAMACNLPIVSVNCGDVKERLKGVKPAYVCSYSVDDLGNALASILLDKRRSNGREILEQQGLSSSSFVKRISEIYKTLNPIES